VTVPAKARDERARKNPHADAALRETFFVISMRIANAMSVAREMPRPRENTHIRRDEMRSIRYRHRINKPANDGGRFVTRLTDTPDADWLLCAARVAVAIAAQPGIAPSFVASHKSFARPSASSPH